MKEGEQTRSGGDPSPHKRSQITAFAEKLQLQSHDYGPGQDTHKHTKKAFLSSASRSQANNGTSPPQKARAPAVVNGLSSLPIQYGRLLFSLCSRPRRARLFEGGSSAYLRADEVPHSSVAC